MGIRVVVGLTLVLAFAGCISYRMERPPETLAERCARTPAIPACRYLTPSVPEVR